MKRELMFSINKSFIQWVYDVAAHGALYICGILNFGHDYVEIRLGLLQSFQLKISSFSAKWEDVELVYFWEKIDIEFVDWIWNYNLYFIIERKLKWFYGMIKNVYLAVDEEGA